MNGRTVEVLEPCKYCKGSVSCEWCDGGGWIWAERCYTGSLDDGEFLYWQVR